MPQNEPRISFPSLQQGSGSDKAGVRRWIALAAAFLFTFGVLHHLDHAIRGNHVGWPLQPDLNPFTYSLLVYPLVALGLSALTCGRVWAAFWFVYGLAILGLVAATHFIPPLRVEPLRDIVMPYLEPLATDRYEPAPTEHLAWFLERVGPYSGPLLATLAVMVLMGLVVSAVMLVVVSVRARHVQGHW